MREFIRDENAHGPTGFGVTLPRFEAIHPVSAKKGKVVLILGIIAVILLFSGFVFTLFNVMLFGIAMALLLVVWKGPIKFQTKAWLTVIAVILIGLGLWL